MSVKLASSYKHICITVYGYTEIDYKYIRAYASPVRRKNPPFPSELGQIPTQREGKNRMIKK